MVDPTLIARAVECGLNLLECGTCEGRKACDCTACSDDLYLASGCLACDGTGKDTSARGLLAAAMVWKGCGKEYVLRYGHRPRFCVPIGNDWRWWDHDNTVESMAEAALRAIVGYGEAR